MQFYLASVWYTLDNAKELTRLAAGWSSDLTAVTHIWKEAIQKPISTKHWKHKPIYISISIEITNNNKINLILIRKTILQDVTHSSVEVIISSYDIFGITYHHIYGMITYAGKNIESFKLLSSSTAKDTHRIDVGVERIKVFTIYKPQVSLWTTKNLPWSTHLTIYDFNSHKPNWNTIRTTIMAKC